MATELLFSRLGPELWVARRERGRVVELRLADPRARLATGDILRLRVRKVVEGIQSAFLDVGEHPDAYLNAHDLLLPAELAQLEPGAWRLKRREIERRLNSGDRLTVQVEREPFAGKGARVRSQISLAGRFLVHMPQLEVRAVSRRIGDDAVRERLLASLGALGGPGGFVARTVAAEADDEQLAAEAAQLRRRWQAIAERAEGARPPAHLYRDAELPEAVLRDLSPDTIDRILFDSPEDLARAREGHGEPRLVERMALHDRPEPLYDSFADDVERSLRRRVWLKSGGTIAIDETEALVAIDVNTSRSVGRGGARRVELQTNLEAVAEIARQLRLRDLGGVIVIDFIDLENDAARKEVLDALGAALAADPVRTTLGEFSRFGLVELTRRRSRATLGAMLSEELPAAEGRGRRFNARRHAQQLYRDVAAGGRGRPFTLRAHPELIAEIDAAFAATEHAAFPREALAATPDASLPPGQAAY